MASPRVREEDKKRPKKRKLSQLIPYSFNPLIHLILLSLFLSPSSHSTIQSSLPLRLISSFFLFSLNSIHAVTINGLEAETGHQKHKTVLFFFYPSKSERKEGRTEERERERNGRERKPRKLRKRQSGRKRGQIDLSTTKTKEIPFSLSLCLFFSVSKVRNISRWS